MHLRRGPVGRSEEVDHTPAAVGPYLETAAARGVDEIGFTEHVYYFRQTREIWINEYERQRCVHDLDLYCDTILDAKRQGLPVKLGLEVDYVGDRQERLTELLAGYPWDFLLGSVHYIGELAIDQPPGIWADHSVEERLAPLRRRARGAGRVRVRRRSRPPRPAEDLLAASRAGGAGRAARADGRDGRPHRRRARDLDCRPPQAGRGAVSRPAAPAGLRRARRPDHARLRRAPAGRRGSRSRPGASRSRARAGARL